jgi:hypothetical protein
MFSFALSDLSWGNCSQQVDYCTCAAVLTANNRKGIPACNQQQEECYAFNRVCLYFIKLAAAAYAAATTMHAL